MLVCYLQLQSQIATTNYYHKLKLQITITKYRLKLQITITITDTPYQTDEEKTNFQSLESNILQI
jgi:biotin synthase-related radical SAM superfamily protein